MAFPVDIDALSKFLIGFTLFVGFVFGPYCLERFNEFRLTRKLASRYVFANPKWDAEAKEEFRKSAHEVIKRGHALAKDQPFLVNDASSPRLVLPTKYIDEIKNEERLDFHSYIAKQFFATYPGFDAFSTSINQTVFQDAVRTQLAQALALTIQPMANEEPHTLDLVFGDAPEWKETILVPAILKCIARLSALVFLGESFMNNPEWQRISVMYTVDAFMAASALNNWPAPLRPLVHWFLPECKKIRQEVKLAKALITPEVERRRKELAENGGKPRRKVLDSVDWFTASAKGQPFDYANAELSLSMAGTHTTTNTMGFAFCDLLEHPEYIGLLREEIRAVWKEEGKWDKSTLYKLKLMDSFIKESMRLHPHSFFNLARRATADVKLRDGNFIPKGAFTAMGPIPMYDENIWPNADKFDGHRFLKLRQTAGGESKYQTVSTSPDFLVFGYGSHACPGRSFAINEIKLLLSGMILHYDWKLPEGQTKVQHRVNGYTSSPNPQQIILFKSRKPVEIQG